MSAEVIHINPVKSNLEKNDDLSIPVEEVRDNIESIVGIDYQLEPYRSLQKLGFQNIDYKFREDVAIKQIWFSDVVQIGNLYIHKIIGVIWVKDANDLPGIKKVKELGRFLFVSSGKKVFIFDTEFQALLFKLDANDINRWIIQGQKKPLEVMQISNGKTLYLNEQGWLKILTIKLLLKRMELDSFIIDENMGKEEVSQVLETYTIWENIGIYKCRSLWYDFLIIVVNGKVMQIPFVQDAYLFQVWGKLLYKVIQSNTVQYYDANMCNITESITKDGEVIFNMKKSPIGGWEYLEAFSREQESLGLVSYKKFENIKGF